MTISTSGEWAWQVWYNSDPNKLKIEQKNKQFTLSKSGIDSEGWHSLGIVPSGYVLAVKPQVVKAGQWTDRSIPWTGSWSNTYGEGGPLSGSRNVRISTVKPEVSQEWTGLNSFRIVIRYRWIDDNAYVYYRKLMGGSIWDSSGELFTCFESKLAEIPKGLVEARSMVRAGSDLRFVDIKQETWSFTSLDDRVASTVIEAKGVRMYTIYEPDKWCLRVWSYPSEWMEGRGSVILKLADLNSGEVRFTFKPVAAEG